MKKLIIAAALTTLFSTAVNANSGLADRINEARTLPNKEVETPDSQMLCMEHKKLHSKMSQLGVSEKPHKEIGKC